MTTVLLAINIIISLSAIIVIYLVYKKISTKSDDDKLINSVSELLEKNTEQLVKNVNSEFDRNRADNSRTSKELREEVVNSIKLFGDQLASRMNDISERQKEQLDIFSDQLQKLVTTNESKFENLQNKVENKLKDLQDNNSKKLEEMRVTVDEKLHSTLEKRLGESFKQVSDRLELVHKGLGEMQTLANGVGDLKKVLTNVKTRGTWGEIQLENLIDQVLTIDQYGKNVATKKGSAARVEFAIKLPGRSELKDETVWMPVDAKFPMDIYQRLQESQDTADVAAIETSRKELERRIKEEAKSISTKYVDPPNTTDFAFMFLPIEGLYAEVLNIVGLFEFVQREHKVTIVGPTTFSAVLNSLQMGFRTLVIEKRSSEVWKLLGVVKTEFGKFGDILEKTHTKLEQASKTIGDASKKSRTIERKLRDVQELPASSDTKNLEDGNSIFE